MIEQVYSRTHRLYVSSKSRIIKNRSYVPIWNEWK